MTKLIGTGNNQIPTNGMLGGMAFQSPEDVSVDKIQENNENVVTQTDVGSDPNQIPLNGMLGDMAYQNAEGFFVPELISTRPFYFTKTDPNSIYSGYTVADSNSYVVRGTCQRIGHMDAKVFENPYGKYYTGNSCRLLINGERQRVLTNANGNVSGTNIPLLQFKFRSPYRGTVYSTIKYVITADGSYSAVTGELYLIIRDYNSGQTINKTTSAGTTRNITGLHSSTGTHHLQYAFLDNIPSSGNEGNVGLYVYGTGAQYGNYNIAFSLEVTNLATMDNATAAGIYDLAYPN